MKWRDRYLDPPRPKTRIVLWHDDASEPDIVRTVEDDGSILSTTEQDINDRWAMEDEGYRRWKIHMPGAHEIEEWVDRQTEGHEAPKWRPGGPMALLHLLEDEGVSLNQVDLIRYGGEFKTWRSADRASRDKGLWIMSGPRGRPIWIAVPREAGE